MRKIIVLSMISLDGVMQAPGGREEDTSNGFEYGGWVAPYTDELSGEIMQKQMQPADLLLGRKTYDIFAGYWPQHADYWPGINEVKKYVLSNTVTASDWQNCTFLTGIEDIKNLKNTEGGDIQVHGSGELVKLLLAHGLADELWMKIFPVILGNGKKLFDDEAMAAAFTLTESHITSKGVIFANYTKAGEVKTGNIGE